MNIMDELKALGVDVADGLERVMGDESLYDMMLGMFLDAVRDNPVSLADFDGGDMDALTKHIHTLKGITGNLSMTPLYEGYNKSLGELRANQVKQAKATFEAMLPTQEKIVACIKQHNGLA